MGLKHSYHSTKTDPADPTIIGATKWNADHFYVDAAGAPIANVGALLLAGAAGALTHLNSVAAGQVLIAAGAGVLPAWSASPTLASLTVDATGTIAWATRTKMTSPADGRLLLTTAAGTDFNMLQLGGTTGSFPALRRSGAAIIVSTADGAALASVQSYDHYTSGSLVFFGGNNCRISAGLGTPEGAVAATVGSLFLRSDGGAGTTLYVKQGGSGTNTGWVAK